MTEIQFLIDLLLNEPMTKELSEKLLKRIGSIEMEKAGTPKFVPPNLDQIILMAPRHHDFFTGCQHEYPSPWLSITPPTCLKCGEASFVPSITCETILP